MPTSLIELKHLSDLDLNPGQLEPSANRHCPLIYNGV